MLKLFGNDDRLLLLCQMSMKECTVSELEQLTGIAQPALSQQLSLLRRQRVVSTRRDGKYIWYRLVDARASRMMRLVYELFCMQQTPEAELALDGPAERQNQPAVMR